MTESRYIFRLIRVVWQQRLVRNAKRTPQGSAWKPLLYTISTKFEYLHFKIAQLLFTFNINSSFASVVEDCYGNLINTFSPASHRLLQRKSIVRVLWRRTRNFCTRFHWMAKRRDLFLLLLIRNGLSAGEVVPHVRGWIRTCERAPATWQVRGTGGGVRFLATYSPVYWHRLIPSDKWIERCFAMCRLICVGERHTWAARYRVAAKCTNHCL